MLSLFSCSRSAIQYSAFWYQSPSYPSANYYPVSRRSLCEPSSASYHPQHQSRNTSPSFSICRRVVVAVVIQVPNTHLLDQAFTYQCVLHLSSCPRSREAAPNPMSFNRFSCVQKSVIINQDDAWEPELDDHPLFGGIIKLVPEVSLILQTGGRALTHEWA